MNTLQNLTDDELLEYRSLLEKQRKEVTHGNRAVIVEVHGYDIKSAYHVVRLLDEAEQILAEGTINLQRSAEVLKSIRRGEWTLDDIKGYFARGEVALETLYHESKLRYSPDEEAIKHLLINCLEEHFGSLNNVVHDPGKDRAALQEIAEIVYRTLH